MTRLRGTASRRQRRRARTDSRWPSCERRSTARGLDDVSTILQSGNVLFSLRRAGAAAATLVAAAIEDAFGAPDRRRRPLGGRARSRRRAEPVPRRSRDRDPTTLHVAFLSERPADAAVAKLEPDRSPPDAFVVSGREVYLSYPNGSGRSRLTLDYLERRLGTSRERRGTGARCSASQTRSPLRDTGCARSGPPRLRRPRGRSPRGRPARPRAPRSERRKRLHACCSCQTAPSSQTQNVGTWRARERPRAERRRRPRRPSPRPSPRARCRRPTCKRGGSRTRRRSGGGSTKPRPSSSDRPPPRLVDEALARQHRRSQAGPARRRRRCRTTSGSRARRASTAGPGAIDLRHVPVVGATPASRRALISDPRPA